MSFIYDLAKEKMMKPGTLSATTGDNIHLVTDDIKCCFVDTSYTPDQAAHDDFNDLAGVVAENNGTTIADCPSMTSKTVAGMVFDAADTIFASVTGTVPIQGLVIFKDTGTSATSPLIAFIDQGTGLTFTPNGGDVTVEWQNSPSQLIFSL